MHQLLCQGQGLELWEEGEGEENAEKGTMAAGGVHGRDGAVSQRGSRSCGAPRTGWVQAAGDGGRQRGVCTWGVQGMGVLGSG